MAVGDGGNDLAMLSGVTGAGGLGVAMANAVPAVRRVLWLEAAKSTTHMECSCVGNLMPRKIFQVSCN